MRTRIIAAACLLAGGLLAGCSNGGDSNAADKTSTPTAAPAVSTSATTAATAAATSPAASLKVKLSTDWVPKIDALTSGKGTSACSSDSGSDDCLNGMTDSVTLLGQIVHAIGAANAQDEYPKTIAEITKLMNAADTYNKDECPGDPNADVDGSPCPKNALAVTVGMSALVFVMQTDELTAGVA